MGCLLSRPVALFGTRRFLVRVRLSLLSQSKALVRNEFCIVYG